MMEIAAAGGCLTVPATDSTAIEQGLERLADNPSLRLRLLARGLRENTFLARLRRRGRGCSECHAAITSNHRH